MKKIMLMFVCVFMLTGCFPSKSGLIHMKAEEAVTAIENKDSMILMIASKTCGACIEFKKVVDEFVANYDVRIHEVYLDEDQTKDPESGEVKTPNIDKLEEHIGIVGGTPSVFFIENGVIKGTFTGSISYDSFKSKVEKYGFMPQK